MKALNVQLERHLGLDVGDRHVDAGVRLHRQRLRRRLAVDDQGYVHAPTKPGLGYEIDHDKLEGMLEKVET